jgi:hypothetical protein
LIIVSIAVAAIGLSGCSKKIEAIFGGGGHGRYQGVGLYPAGEIWSQMVVAEPPKDTAASRTNDDEQVIVVIDSTTGELRQCGNVSGHCIGMNPWSKALGSSQMAPIPLGKHADQLAQEAAAAGRR